MRKRVALPLIFGSVVVLVAAYLVWSNLTNRSLFVGLSVAAGVAPAGGPPAALSSGRAAVPGSRSVDSGYVQASQGSGPGAGRTVAETTRPANVSGHSSSVATAAGGPDAPSAAPATAGATPATTAGGGVPSVPPGSRPGTNPVGSPAPGSGNSTARPARTAQAHPVRTATATTGPMETYVRLNGEVEAATRVDVFPEVAGKVDRINVTVGSWVDTKTVLFTVDPSRPGTRYEPNPVHSPIAGTVIAVAVTGGQAVTTATPAVTVATIGDLELRVRVPERYASIVTPRSIARVTFDALGGKSFEARIKRLQPVIDPVSRSKEAVFALRGGSSGIEPGMFASVELVSAHVENAVIVPFEAIVQETDGNSVFIAQDGRAVRQPVEIGLLAGEMVQIRSGLSGGESVITTGQTFLDDGSPISVVTNAANSASGRASR